MQAANASIVPLTELDCWTQQAIADEIGEPLATVNRWILIRERDSSLGNAPGATNDKPWGSNWIEKRELDSEISKAPGATNDKPWGSNWIQKREKDSEFCKPPGATADKPWGSVLTELLGATLSFLCCV